MKTLNLRKFRLCLIDLMLVTITYYCNVVIFLFDNNTSSIIEKYTLLNLFVYIAILFCVRSFAHVYGVIWRYANSETYLRLALADILAFIIYLALSYYTSVLWMGFIYNCVLSMSVLTVTMFSRYIYQYVYARRKYWYRYNKSNPVNNYNKTNVVIVGAGNMGVSLAQTLMRNPEANYKPYAFVDKDPHKIGNTLNGLPVLPADDDIIEKIKTMPIQEIIIAIPELSPEEKNRIYNIFLKTGRKVKLYDNPMNVMGNGVIRDFRIEDLLYRDTIKINNHKTACYYSDKSILVTGGGGSIGSEICRQIAKQHPKKLIILDIYENNAYEIQQELLRAYNNSLNFDVVIGSVRDYQRMNDIFAQYRPDIVIHAAAHKHVPLMEASACEAIKNNVFGTYNIANLSEKYGVKKFILISSDKAVNPTNIMGASKRLCEMAIQCRTDSHTEFCAVRFGNVLGSNGSVVPLFKKQIECGGPVTITDRRMIRYFMTIEEAVQLVLEAGSMANNGELFVLDMGKPVKILDLAESMIKLAGLEPYKDINIVEIGLRPGEKLYEELLMANETLKKTDNDMIFIEMDKPCTREEIEEKLDILYAALKDGGNSAIIEAIRKTVPTYRDPEEVNNKVNYNDIQRVEVMAGR